MGDEQPAARRPSSIPGIAISRSEEDVALRNAVGTFTVSLLKALFQTSSLGTEHEATRRAMEDFLGGFGVLPPEVAEVSYVAGSLEVKPEIQVEGVSAEALPLRACLRPTVRDEFLGKLHRFFEYHRLISLSVRRDLEAGELEQFLRWSRRGLSVTPPTDAASAQPPRLSDVLLQQGVSGIGVVCRDDLLFGSRTVPWRVRVAISRLSKNLRGVPFYARATRLALRDAHARLVGDIIRPLTSRELLLELLVNCDLVGAYPELAGLDVEDRILQTVPSARLAGVLGAVAAELSSGGGAAARESERRAGVLRVLRKAVPYAAGVLDEDVVALFRRFVADGVLVLEQLPAHVQRALHGEEIADRFLAHPKEHLERLRGARGLDSFRGFAAVVALLVAELTRRHEYAWAGAVVDAVTAHEQAEEAPPRLRELARQALAAMASPANLERAATDAAAGEPATREAAARFLERFGAEAAEALVERLDKAAEDETNEALVAVLRRLGDAAVPRVLAGLGREGRKAGFYRALLQVLAARPSPREAFERVQAFVGHEQAAVREAACLALGSLGGPQVEGLLLGRLEDAELGVQAAAVRGLAVGGSQDPRLARFLDEALVAAGRSAVGDALRDFVAGRAGQLRRQRLSLLTVCAAAIRARLDASVPSPEGLDERLAEALEHLARTAAAEEPAEAGERRAAALELIRALRRLPSDRSLAALRKAREDDDEAIAAAAGSAIGAVRNVQRATLPPSGDPLRQSWFDRLRKKK